MVDPASLPEGGVLPPGLPTQPLFEHAERGIQKGLDPSLIAQGVLTFPPRMMGVLGAVAWLGQFSAIHARYTIQELRSRVIPSLVTNQFRLYANKTNPIAFVNWAIMDAGTESRFAAGDYVLSLPEWVSGQRVWVIELIAPFGNVAHVLRDLQKTQFAAGTTLRGLRQRPDGSIQRRCRITARGQPAPPA